MCRNWRMPAAELGAKGQRLTNVGVSGKGRNTPRLSLSAARLHNTACARAQSPAEQHTTSCMVGYGQGLREHALHLALGCAYIIPPPLQAAWAAVSAGRQTQRAPAASQKSPTLDWPFRCLRGDLWFRPAVSHRRDDEAAPKWQETLT